jgi:hypothetical protein
MIWNALTHPENGILCITSRENHLKITLQCCFDLSSSSYTGKLFTDERVVNVSYRKAPLVRIDVPVRAVAMAEHL